MNQATPLAGYLRYAAALSTPSPTPTPTPTYALSGPTAGTAGAAAAFTLTPGTTIPLDTATPSDGGGGGVFSPSSLPFSGASGPVGFTYTNASAGTYAISVASQAGYTVTPASISIVLSSPPAYGLAGPSGGTAGAAIAFTITPTETVASDTVSVSDGGAGGRFSQAAVGFTATARPAGFTYTNDAAGHYTITAASAAHYTVTPSSVSLTLAAPTPAPTPTPVPTPAPNPGPPPTGRGRDARNDIRERLLATNAFSEVFMTSPDEYTIPSSDVTAAAIEPGPGREIDRWDDDDGEVVALVEEVAVLTILVRRNDPQERDETAEQLVQVAKNAVAGRSLGGFTIPDMTRILTWKPMPPKAPERRYVAPVTFQYLVSGWGAHDENP